MDATLKENSDVDGHKNNYTNSNTSNITNDVDNNTTTNGQQAEVEGGDGGADSGGVDGGGGEEEKQQRILSPFPYSENEDILLPEGYTPTNYDIINGRGRKSYNHIANRRFRQLIAMNLGRYLEARCKVDKTLVVVGLVNAIRNAKPTGGFIKRDPETNRWISMSDEAAREKVGHCLRDMIASQRQEKKNIENGKIPKSKKSTTKNANKTNSKKDKNEHQNVISSSSGIATKNGNNDSINTQEENSMPPLHAPWLGRGGAELPLPPLPGSGGSGGMWQNGGQNGGPAFPGSNGYPPFAPMFNAAAAAAAAAANARAMQMNVPLSFSNVDSVSLMQRGNLQDMSEQQRNILKKLEGGFKGTVEELMDSV